MSILNKMTYSQVVSELSNVTYSEAVAHYNSLKSSFLSQYGFAAQQSAIEIEKMFQEEIVSEINQEGIAEQTELSSRLFEQVRQEVIHQLQGNRSLNSLRQKLQQQGKSKKEQATTEFKAGLNLILSEQKMKELVLQSLSKYNAATNGFDINDILNQVRSYRNRLILLRTNASAKYYKRSTKGYFREALIHKAFSRISEHLDGRISAIPTGSLKNASGKDTVYDEFIDFFNNIQTSFSETINEQFNSNTGFGIQVKSWSAPWETDSNSPWTRYSMGGQAELFNYMNKLHYNCNTWSWIHGVQFLENYLTSAVGPRQVGFVTGQRFYWTCDLIASFRQMNYFYAFVFDKYHKATSAASWQTINMDI